MLSRLTASKGDSQGARAQCPREHGGARPPAAGFGLGVHLEPWEPFQHVHLWGKGAVQTECRPLS